MSTTQNGTEHFQCPDKAAFMVAGPLGCPINPSGAASLWSVCREVAHGARTHFSARRRRSR